LRQKKRQSLDAAADEQLTMKLKGKLVDSYKKLAEAHPKVSGVTQKVEVAFRGVTQKVEVYYIEVKEGFVHIVGSINNKVVYIQARVCEIAGPTVEKLRDACFTVGASAKAHIQQAQGAVKGKASEGYIYISATVEGQAICIKGHVDVMHANALKSYGRMAEVTADYTAPIRSKAVALGEASKAKAQKTYGVAMDAVHDYSAPVMSTAVALYDKADRVVQPLKPHYVQAKNGVVFIIATVGKNVTVIQVKIGDVCNTMQVRTVSSIAGARAAIEGCTGPVVCRLSNGYAGCKSSIAPRIVSLNISFTNGIICVRDMTGERIALLQLKLSEAVVALRKGGSDGFCSSKQVVLELVQNVLPALSAAFGKARDSIKVLGHRAQDGVMYIACQLNERVFVINIRIVEVVEFAKSKSVELSHVLVDKCIVGKTTALRAIEAMKTKARETSTELSSNGRTLAANPKARVTAASAAGGAIALGASGGATGLVAGGALGAACGIPAAFFTFGLSIPVGAMLGAGTGACVGTAAGGTAGLVTGGAAGYSAHTAHAHKAEIGAKAKAYKDIAAASSNKLRANIMAVAVAGTGGAVA